MSLVLVIAFVIVIVCYRCDHLSVVRYHIVARELVTDPSPSWHYHTFVRYYCAMLASPPLVLVVLVGAQPTLGRPLPSPRKDCPASPVHICVVSIWGIRSLCRRRGTNPPLLYCQARKFGLVVQQSNIAVGGG